MTARVVAFAQQKGGEAKTTSVVNVAASLAAKGKRVLLVDSDPQGNATSSCCVLPDDHQFGVTTYSVYGDPLEHSDVYELDHGFHLLPTTVDLAAVEWECNFHSNSANSFMLTKTLEKVREFYDFILIDLPPTLGTLTVNGLVAATDVMIPLNPEPYSVAGIQELLETIHNVRVLNPSVAVLGVFLTKVMRNNLHRQVEQETREFFEQIGIPVFQTAIKHTSDFGKAAAKHVPAVLAFKRNASVQAYMDLVEEAFGL